MKNIWEGGASATAPTAPASPSVGYPTDGNPATNTQPTVPGAYWFHQITMELINAIQAAGLTPNQSDLTQLAQSLAKFLPTAGGSVTGDFKAKTPLVYTSSVANFYGDSITVGVGASAQANAWAYLLTSRMGWTMNNGAISGGSIMDWIVNAYSQTVNADSVSLVLPGFNDQRYVGSNSGQQLAYRGALYAALAHLAIPDAQKIKGNDSRITYGGTWSASPVRSYGRYTSTIGSTASFSVSGSTVYISTIQQTSNGGTMQVSIDGVDMGSYSLQTAVGNGGAVSTINYMPLLLRFPGLSDGKHSVVITKTDASASSLNVWIDWVAGSNPTSAGQSRVYCGSTLRMNPTGSGGSAPYNNYTESVNRAFCLIAEQACADLASDGLDVQYVKTNGAFTPENSSEINADNIHPADLGHSNIFGAFLQSLVTSMRPAAVTAAIAGIRRLRANSPVKGTWVPTLSGLVSAGANTYTAQQGEYVSDGVRCVATFRIVVSAIAGGPSGAVVVSLPLPAAATSIPYTGSISLHKGVTLDASADGLYIETVPGTNQAIIRQGYSSAEANLPWGNIAGGAEIRGSITYAL